ncbi:MULTISPECIES: PSD1 and planctomycete cytochrome C domain-containing protein [Rhodopirellula]|uniref:PSD1 and planctomycete cytochrome C domain-containing protein n=1 Tax=Rhodopirellula TaxID=265488 RepID=UPI002580C2E6|nr:PSD1 and planctomycete cytochrome C domain-containing protein [Rhodopirellula sp. UBA1907]
MTKPSPTALFAVVCVSILCVRTSHAEEVSFNRDIRPILSDRCYFCHGFDENHRAADLRLDLREEAEYVWDVDSPDDSELLLRITSDDPDMVMPPPDAHKEPISKAEADLIRRWIEEGAKYEPHWSFVNPTRPTTAAKNTSDAIDDFVGRRHKEQNLQFADEAEPSKWLRRVSLDLTGVPPTAQEMRSFEFDAAEQGEVAYEKAVDRLLASPLYGERMTLEWLDVARYADTNGFQSDAYRMNWPWRDWVIDAFNANMPFDQFTIEQLAGDQLPNPTQEQLIATAFNRNHMIQAEGGSIAEENRAKNNFDRVETTSTAWMGLTVGCCQCHDHKFDPLKQSDYFSLMSFFNQISETGMTSKKMSVKHPDRPFSVNYWVDKPFIEVGDDATKQSFKDAQEEVKAAKQDLKSHYDEYVAGARQWVQEIRDDPEEGAKRIKPGEYVARFVLSADLNNPKDNGFKRLIDTYLSRNEPWKSMKDRIAKAEAKANLLQEQMPLVMVMRDDQPRETFVMLRGNYETLGEKVTPKTPDFLPPLSPNEADDRLNRLDLAKWLVSDEHPLTARVTVNRYWQLMFGRGLVATPDDFGLQGALPTHPDLLDWLAVDFRESGWDVKALLKGMVLSRTYRQSAITDEDRIEQDPENKWLARGSRQRLDSRLLRDQALMLSGLLQDEMGGPPVAPYQPGGIWESMSLNKNHYMRDDGKDLYRRSLYTVWRRVVAPANFFDVASRQSCSVTLNRTSTPLHALTTLNDITYVEAARVWAESFANLKDDRTRLADMFFAATGRHASEDELDSLHRSLQKARVNFRSHRDEAAELLTTGEAPRNEQLDPAEHAAWTTVCLLVLNLDETLCK